MKPTLPAAALGEPNGPGDTLRSMPTVCAEDPRERVRRVLAAYRATRNPNVLDELIRYYQAPLLAAISRRVFDGSLRMDVFDRVWEKVLEHPESYEPKDGTDPFLGWLRTLADCEYQTMTTASRRWNQRHEVADFDRVEGRAPSPFDATSSAECWPKVLAVWETLKPRERKVSIYVFWEGLKPAEIAMRLGTRGSTTRAIIHRTKKKLAKLLNGGRP